MLSIKSSIIAALIMMSGAGCALLRSDEPSDGTVSNNTGSEPVNHNAGFDEWKKTLYYLSDNDTYVVPGNDVPLHTHEELEAYYTHYVQKGALVIDAPSGTPVPWPAVDESAITYCISTSFGSDYDTVVKGMACAASAWEGVAHVDFIHVPSEDGSCDQNNGNVKFDVRPLAPFPNSRAAYAFYPGWPRSQRSIYLLPEAFGSFWSDHFHGLLRHELGHALGFHHEHNRLTTEQGIALDVNICGAPDNVHNLTPYDQASAMHYPNTQCGGNGDFDQKLSYWDGVGAALAYGSPEWMSGHGTGSDNQFLADVNGDGLADAIVFFNDHGTPDLQGSWYVALSTGTDFGPYYQHWMNGHGTGSDNQFLADVNGDGLADAIVFFNNHGTPDLQGSWYVALSTGTGFGPYYQHWMNGHGTGSDNQFLADVNGDGLDDAVVFFNDHGTPDLQGSWYVALSTGAGFGPYYQHWMNGHGAGSWNQMMADVNGDGRADAIVYFGEDTQFSSGCGLGGLYTAFSNGNSFGPYFSTAWAEGPWSWSKNQLLGDTNGDGKSDALFFFDDGSWYGKLSP